MKILLSPAKTMQAAVKQRPATEPLFLREAAILQNAVRALTFEEAKRLWRCNNALTALNCARFAEMDLSRNTAPALFAYTGLQYRRIAPSSLTAVELGYLQERLRIVSGLYGLLRPLDGIVPYRLEMQARLAVGAAKDIYGFWGAKLAAALSQDETVFLNLASQEYARAVQPHLPAGAAFITCAFASRTEKGLQQKSTPAKMARGEMVRWLAVHGAQSPNAAKAFSALGFRFSPEHSRPDEFVFVQEGLA